MPLVDVDWETFSEASVYREADWQNTKLAANYLRSACEPEDFRRSHDARYGTDVTCLVSLVSCPTLVVSTRAETWPAAQFYAREIPNAQLLRLDEEKNYHPLAAPTEEVWEIIASFADLPTRRTNGSDAGHSHTNGHSDGNGNGNGALGANGVLTLRERDVLKLVARGYTNKQIADELELSVKTVETYRARVMQKLELHSRAELVRYLRARSPS
jgi:DNA-binding CsgD family transcriptional regulator